MTYVNEIRILPQGEHLYRIQYKGGEFRDRESERDALKLALKLSEEDPALISVYDGHGFKYRVDDHRLRYSSYVLNEEEG